MTLKRYLFESNRQGLATITALGNDGRPFICLEQTWFHPQGGGQKADRGTIANIPVTHIAHSDGEVNHYLETTADLQRGQEVEVAVDADWRKTNAQLHTGGHLIAAITEKLFPTLQAVAGHHWPGEARVEFVYQQTPNPVEVSALLEPALRDAIEADLAVSIVGDPLTARAIQIGDFTAVPCGGTHLERLGQLDQIILTGIKLKGGKLRISYQTA
ncbi:MAG: alanyl-tRNA editing protein [Acidobacteriota bacterium]